MKSASVRKTRLLGKAKAAAGFHPRSPQPEPGSSADLQGLSAYQNIQGAGRAGFVDTRAGLG
jgi:hypothetical protein